MLTTTQKLLIVRAFKIYDDIEKTKLYLACRTKLELNKLNEFYQEIVQESITNGYNDPLEFCLNKRKKRLKKLILEKKGVKNNIFKFEETEEEILIEPIKPIKLQYEKIYHNENEKNYLIMQPKPILMPIGQKIEEKAELEIIRPPQVPKRILNRMGDEERRVEGRILELEENFLLDSMPVKPQSSILPPLLIIKPKPEIQVFLDEPIRRSSSLEDQYSLIIHKYLNNKRSSQDKGQWPGEYKIIVRYLIMSIKEKEPEEPALIKLQKIVNEKHDQNLQYAVVKVMEIIQYLIFEKKSYKLRKLLNIIKNRLSLFNDFYRK